MIQKKKKRILSTFAMKKVAHLNLLSIPKCWVWLRENYENVLLKNNLMDLCSGWRRILALWHEIFSFGF